MFVNWKFWMLSPRPWNESTSGALPPESAEGGYTMARRVWPSTFHVIISALSAARTECTNRAAAATLRPNFTNRLVISAPRFQEGFAPDTRPPHKSTQLFGQAHG